MMDPAEAKRVGDHIRDGVGKTIKPADYPKAVAIWNRAIAAEHGIEFDTSHDRERQPERA